MNDPQVDGLLNEAAAKQEVDPALLARISASIGASAKPVRPLPSTAALITGLLMICGGVAVGGAVRLGLHGIQKMTSAEIGLIFSVLGILTWVGASLCVAEHVPGSRRIVSPAHLIVLGCITLAGTFAAVFHDYHTHRFVAAGMTCLIAGLVDAIPASAAAWWLLHRGLALNPRAAGLAKGALAGLAGITMLDLHCANFEAPHVIVWHIAVLPLSGALGMLAERTFVRRRSLP